jgi:hypothetical protein
MKKFILLLFISLTVLISSGQDQALISNVRKISATQGGFTGQLDEGDQFAVAEIIGDVDGDGIEDLAIGAFRDDDGGTNHGAVWILFMNEDRSIKGTQKISSLEGNFTGELGVNDLFGKSITTLGDLDKDGVIDIAVGAPYDNDYINGSGAVWILFLNTDGTVKSQQKISATKGGMIGVSANDIFGWSVTSLGDFDGDGNADIAVGSPTFDSDGGWYTGCVWILLLNSDGTVKEQHRISDSVGNLGYTLDDEDKFGQAVENIGDINDDGIIDLAVGASFDDDSLSNSGALYILLLNSDCTVKKTQKINNSIGNFNGSLNYNDQFGSAITGLGDIDGDGVDDIAVGAINGDDGGSDRGNVWILNLNTDGTVLNGQKISSLTSDFNGLVDDVDYLGFSLSVFEKLSVENKKQLAISAWGDDDGYTNAGAVYILDLDVKHKPTAMAGNDIIACISNTYKINGVNSSVPDNDPLSYSWVCPEAPELNNESISFSFVAPEVEMTQSYNFILTVSCQGIFSDPDTISIIVKPLPQVPTIEQFADTLLASKAFNYFWYYNGTQIAGENDSVLIISKTGEYQVKQNNEFGCMSEISPSYHIIFSSVNSLNNQIKFFPNPVTENFNVSGFEGTALLTVTDLNGKIYLSKRILQHELINASTLPRGVYFAKLQKENIVVNEKFIKY